MKDSIQIKKARIEDIPFIIEAIVQAEKSGTERLSYSTIYNLPEEEVKGLLVDMLEEDIKGQELCLSQFSVAMVSGKRASCLSSWIEGEHGDSSSLKAALLAHYLSIENLKYSLQFRSIFNDLRLQRIPGTLQLECVYSSPEFRGQGVVSSLIHNLAKQNKRKVKQAQLMVDGQNAGAMRAYEKIGFKVSLETESTHELAREILPSNKKSTMLMSIE